MTVKIGDRVLVHKGGNAEGLLLKVETLMFSGSKVRGYRLCDGSTGFYPYEESNFFAIGDEVELLLKDGGKFDQDARWQIGDHAYVCDFPEIDGKPWVAVEFHHGDRARYVFRYTEIKPVEVKPSQTRLDQMIEVVAEIKKVRENGPPKGMAAVFEVMLLANPIVEHLPRLVRLAQAVRESGKDHFLGDSVNEALAPLLLLTTHP